MVFIGLQQGGQWLVEHGTAGVTEQRLLFLYPIKVVLVGGLLFYFLREYCELKLADFKNLIHTGASILFGLLVFILWIKMDWDFATFGEMKGFNPFLVDDNYIRNGLILFRVFGAVLVVPIMEELFWRSFLLRYIINSDFMSIRIGTYTLSSFLFGAVLFGLEHNLVLAGIMAGVAYSLLLYWTKSIYQCILSHAATNLMLAIYVLQTGAWQFW